VSDPPAGAMSVNTKDANAQRTEVIYGAENIIAYALNVISALRSSVDNCVDPIGPSMFVIPDRPITKVYQDMKKRRIKIKFIIEITSDNIQCCKELMNIAEIRHLDEVKGNFGRRMNTVLKRASEILDIATDNKTKLEAMKLLMDLYRSIMSLATEGGIIERAMKIVKGFEREDITKVKMSSDKDEDEEDLEDEEEEITVNDEDEILNEEEEDSREEQ
jgi:hypothetical protein